MIRLAALANGAARRSLPPERSPAEWHQALTAEIAAHLTPHHAALLAVPQAEADGTGWYADGSAVRRHADFSPAERTQLQRNAGAILSDIRRLAESGTAPPVAAAWPALRNIPGLDHLFAVDGRPVLAGWGFAPAAGGAGPMAGLDDGRTGPRLLRLPARVYAATVLALLGLVLVGAALAWVFVPRTAPALVCRVAPGQLELLQQAQREADRAADLHQQIAALDQDAGRKQLNCPVPQVVDPPPPPPRPIPCSANCSLPTPRPPPPPPPKPLPQDRWDRHDLSMLRGCWDRTSNMQLHNIHTGEIADVRSWKMCFDANGRGHQSITLNDGRHCEQGLQARFGNSNDLQIAEDGRCEFPDDNYLLHGEMTCHRESDTEASCPRAALEGPNAGRSNPGMFHREPGQQ
jgi:hypothetical protein